VTRNDLRRLALALCAALTGAAAAAAGAADDAGSSRLLDRPAIGRGLTGGAPLLPRGYHARACGFDMNRNGVVGEPADCHVCDGATADPDGDGIDENLVYVSCNTGADSPVCGSPANPCGSIGYAWNYRLNPPGSVAEDIICFRGICKEENIQPGASGKPGTYIRPQSGTEARGWQLPLNPTMLVGWDYNHNGEYPPYDTGDVAVLDGGGGLARAIRLSVNAPNSYVELAHFTVRDYGRNSAAADTGFLSIGGAAGSSSHIYIHDVSVQDVNLGRPLTSGSIVFNLFTGPTRLRYLAIENVEVLNAGGYVVRGSGPSSGAAEDGPYRFKNLSVTGRACDDSGPGACADPATQAHVVGWKLWGYVDGIEVLDSIVNLNVGAWSPHPTGFGSTAFLAAQCSRNWTIRNNEIDDFKVGLTVQGFASGYCDGPGARPVDGVVFDRNDFRNTYPAWRYGDNGVAIASGGPSPATSIGNVLISNNFFFSSPGWQGMLYVDAGNDGGPDPLRLQLVNNTTVGSLERSGFGNVTLVGNDRYLPQSYLIKDNIFSAPGGAGGENVHAGYAPASWIADANVYDPRGSFTWNQNGYATLDAWRVASSGDGASRMCLPSFLHAAAGNFRLSASDTCARNASEALSGPDDVDLDGFARPATALWDAGAWQFTTTRLGARPPP
jgi:hypothetical protein